MSFKSKFYGPDVKNITEISFSIYTNDMIKKNSAVKSDPFGINVPDSYDNYEPKKGGLVDLRLGTCDIYLNCTTCGQNSNDCEGHFGHTELAEYLFHYGFLNHLITILKCICLKCSNILIERTEDNLKRFHNKPGKYRYKEIKEMVKNINFCNECGTPVPKIKKDIKEASISIKIVLEKEVGATNIDEATGLATEGTRIIRDYLTPRQCYNILRNVSDMDAHLMGFNVNIQRPEDLIMTRFPIPPVVIRPTAKIDFMGSSTHEDSLTLKIADIINYNIRVRNEMNKDSPSLQDSLAFLQYHVAIFFDNDSSALPKSEFKTGGRPINSISDRIKSKEGRMRLNIMGKRVDFSARSVITSDPYIDIDMVGVPLRVAKDLTIPEEVTPQNIKHLTKLVMNGRDIYPGANYVYKLSMVNGKTISQRIDLRYRKANIKLNYGDIVERHIVNDDYVLFNRQPTLHKPSMMGHRIHVLERDDSNTFRMNVSVCKPYNADFDGDEMNIHLAQSIQARNELERIANVKYQIISAKDSNPIIGCVQDSLSGAYIMSMDNNIDYNMACNLLCNTSSLSKSQLKKGEKFNGKQIFSHIIPEGINSVKKKGKDIIFQIKNGELLEGQLDKSQLSTSKNSIIHYVWDKYGPTPTQKFIDDTQRLILNYLLDKGLTVGLKDCIVPIDLVKQLREIIHTKIISANHTLTQYENDYDKITPEIGDGILSMELNAISSNIGKLIMDVLDKDNGLNVMISSKSKGSVVNMTQMTGCLGQVLVESQRIKKRVNGRTLAIFHQNDDTPSARGFIGSSFVDGLKGYEFFFHTMGGREGLIDTAIRTAETGYIQRKCVKFLEDLMVNYEGLIRTANGILVQYLYGDSGIDQQKQTQVKLNLINLNNNTIKEQFTFSDDEIKQLKKKYKIDIDKFNKSMYEKMIEMRDKLRKIYFLSTGNYKVIEDSFMLPINLLRISQEIESVEIMSMEPDYIIERIEDLLTNYDDRFITMMKKNSKLLKEDDQAYKFMLRTGLYEYLSPRKCLFEYKISKDGFDNLIEDIRTLLSRSLVEPGEMVGVVAAQSIGEPTSQLTMNTKHSAGKAGVSGVGRIKEIMSYSKNIKSPQMTIYFDDKYSNKNDANLISSYLKHLTIRELISSAEIFYSIDNKDSLSKLLDNDNVSNPFFVNNAKDNLKSLPFVIRLTMNLEKMMEKETTLLDIKTKFVTYWYKNFSTIKNVKKSHKDILINVDKLAVLSNNDNIIHIRFRLNDFNYNLITSFLNIILDVITLKGIDHIDNVIQSQERRIKFNEDGEIILEKEYIAITDGINLEGIKMLKGINHSRTKINDINTIYINYGIEAARNAIIYELLTTYEANGAGINHAHMSLLVDTMTYSGEVISIDRHGMNKVDNDPISKASFEKTMEHFINAAIFCETDKMTSVSSRIALGRVIGGGTGAFDLILDTEKLKNTEYIENETGGRTNFIPITIEPLFGDIIKNGFARNDFFIPI